MALTGNEPVMPLYENDHSVMVKGAMNESDFQSKGRFLSGLTIRQQFAAMAMQGILSGMDCQGMVNHRSTDSEGVAGLAVIMADALIAELNKEVR